MAATMVNRCMRLETSTFESVKCKHKERVQERLFSHQLMVAVPCVNSIPSGITDCFVEQMSYKLHQLPLYRLIEVPFIRAFVQKGHIHILSYGTKLDTQNCIAVTPAGWLILHLTKDTYQQLGLQAEKQTFEQKKSDIWEVKINLTASCFRPGKKGYDSTLWCLKDRLDLIFDFYIAWEPHDPEVCSSSVGVYFADKCEKVERVDVCQSSQILTSFPCPKVIADDPEGSKGGCHYQEVLEWMGALACGIDLMSEDAGPDSYVSCLTCPEPKINWPRLCVLRASGFITPGIVNKVLEILRSYTDQHSTSLPAILFAQGFSDTPVLNKTTQHSYFVNGDNFYSFFLLPEHKYWLYTSPVS